MCWETDGDKTKERPSVIILSASHGTHSLSLHDRRRKIEHNPWLKNIEKRDFWINYRDGMSVLGVWWEFKKQTRNGP